jgi:hypothetical protein
MNKIFTSMIAVAFAGVSFGAIAQPATKSETKVESSTSVQTPKRDGTEVKVDEKKTTSTTTAKPGAKVEAKTTTTTTTAAPKASSETKVEVKKTEEKKSY